VNVHGGGEVQLDVRTMENTTPGRTRCRRRRVVTAGFVLIVALAGALPAACGGSDQSGAPAQEPGGGDETTPPQTQPEPAPGAEPPGETGSSGDDVAARELPPAVTDTHGAIQAAAQARDYAALEALLDPATFTYSFGESGDPIGYWRALDEEGEAPIVGEILPTVLSMNAAESEGVYVWPAAYAKDPSTWTEEDLADLRLLYSDDDIASFQDLGGYLGYRVGIRDDGTWLFFVAGD
jgi:hypothetical protein